MFKKIIIGVICLTLNYSAIQAMHILGNPPGAKKVVVKKPVKKSFWTKGTKINTRNVKNFTERIENGDFDSNTVEMDTLNTIKKAILCSPPSNRTQMSKDYSSAIDTLAERNLLTPEQALSLKLEDKKLSHSPTKGAIESEETDVASEVAIPVFNLGGDNAIVSGETGDVFEHHCGVADISSNDAQGNPSNFATGGLVEDNFNKDGNSLAQNQENRLDGSSGDSTVNDDFKAPGLSSCDIEKIKNRSGYQAYLFKKNLAKQDNDAATSDKQGLSETPKRTKKTTHISSRMPRVAKIFGAGIMAAGIGYLAHYYFSQQKRTKKK